MSVCQEVIEPQKPVFITKTGFFAKSKDMGSRDAQAVHREWNSKKGVSTMLVLTRKLGEEIVIPSLEVTIRLVEIRGDKVRLGIEAPTQIEVHRKEVWDRMPEFQPHEQPTHQPS